MCQVLNQSVAKTLELTGGDEVTETIKFVDKFDKFFNCTKLNVSSLTAGKLSRNPFKSPFKSFRDFREKVATYVLISVTLSYVFINCNTSG